MGPLRRTALAGLGAVVLVLTLPWRPATRAQALAEADMAGARAAALGASEAERREVTRATALRGTWLWTTADGALTADARTLVESLARADAHGLDPGAYLPPGLAQAIAGADVRDRVTRDAALTLAALRYLHDLHVGRIDPRRLGLRLPAWDEPHDFPRLLAEAAGGHGIAALVDLLTPPGPAYRGLVDALARYRAIGRRPLPDLTRPAASVKPGQPWDGLAAVRARLVAFGDLTAEAAAAAPPGWLDPVTAAALARFQTRHGLTADGVLGARTLAALDVPPAARVRQIEVALERLRWVPDLGARRVIVVNIPMFQLAAWEAGRLAEPPAVAMKVIVGRALRTETPIFVATLDHVIFRPYWNVPVSIVRSEILPALARDPRYLERQQMELVRGQSDQAPVVPADAAGLAALRAGALRLRQRPGPHNALGLVKFVFPNSDSVYMHGTPAPALFARDRRDFSHGCIRVAAPARLAAWVLDGAPGWTAARVDATMQGDISTRVETAAPIDVLLFYATAAVDPVTRAVHFADDIYGHDAALARALATAR